MPEESGGNPEEGTELVTLRMEEDQINQIDGLPGFDSRSDAIRTATGELQLKQKYKTGRADSIDWLIGAYQQDESDMSLRDYVFSSLTDIENEHTPAGYVSTARIDAGQREMYYGAGETLGAAAEDLVDTIYQEALDRASQKYGFNWDD